MTRGSKTLREKAESLSRQHAELMRSDDHDGAAHCDCKLAIQYRKADTAFRSSRHHPPSAEEKFIKAMESLIAKAAESMSPEEFQATSLRAMNLIDQARWSAGETKEKA